MNTPSRVLLPLLLSLATVPQESGPWIEARSTHYSVFYKAGFDKDAEFARTWADRTEQVMKDKYGVVPTHYRMSIYLHPAPTTNANVDTARNRCCSTGADGVGTGTIDVVAPSAAAWKSAGPSSLGLPKTDENYHAKVLMSEYIPIGHWETQAARANGGWTYYTAPNWFVQGLQEYDAIFHTTPANRDVTAKRLLAWAAQHPDAFSCCEGGLKISDAYNGGAAFMAFLAATYGEDVHVKLLRSSAPMFEAALSEVTQPKSLAQLFDAFAAWLRRAPD